MRTTLFCQLKQRAHFSIQVLRAQITSTFERPCNAFLSTVKHRYNEIEGGVAITLL